MIFYAVSIFNENGFEVKYCKSEKEAYGYMKNNKNVTVYESDDIDALMSEIIHDINEETPDKSAFMTLQDEVKSTVSEIVENYDVIEACPALKKQKTMEVIDLINRVYGLNK